MVLPTGHDPIRAIRWIIPVNRSIIPANRPTRYGEWYLKAHAPLTRMPPFIVRGTRSALPPLAAAGGLM